MERGYGKSDNRSDDLLLFCMQTKTLVFLSWNPNGSRKWGCHIRKNTWWNEKHINIDNIINIDFISEHKELHEVKKSKVVEDAGIWQVKYYLYYLWKRGVKGIKGKVDYPLLKKSVIVELSENDIKTLEKIIGEITEIECMDTPPMIVNSKLCKKCAYYDLCFI